MKGLFDNLSQIDSRPPQGQYSDAMLKTMTIAELSGLRDKITSLLPAAALKDVDLERELVIQFAVVKELQNDVLVDRDVPANQKAQVASQVASTLQQMVKMQAEYYNAERFKAVESAVIRAMKRMPLELAQEFLRDYEQIGRE